MIELFLNWQSVGFTKIGHNFRIERIYKFKVKKSFWGKTIGYSKAASILRICSANWLNTYVGPIYYWQNHLSNLLVWGRFLRNLNFGSISLGMNLIRLERRITNMFWTFYNPMTKNGLVWNIFQKVIQMEVWNGSRILDFICDFLKCMQNLDLSICNFQLENTNLLQVIWSQILCGGYAYYFLYFSPSVSPYLRVLFISKILLYL